MSDDDDLRLRLLRAWASGGRPIYSDSNFRAFDELPSRPEGSSSRVASSLRDRLASRGARNAERG